MNSQDDDPNEFEAAEEISNIGLWLYENGHFKNKKLLFQWSMLAAMTNFTQLCFCYYLILDSKFFETQFAEYFKPFSNPDLVKPVICNFGFYKIPLLFIVLNITFS